MAKSKQNARPRRTPLNKADAEQVRLWLYLVKTVLPLERDVNQHLQKQCGQSLTRFDVLAQLDRFGDLGVGQLANRLIASAGNITSLLGRMESEGLVGRAPASDRRASLVRITDLGRDVYWEMVPVHTRIISERLGVLDEKSREQLAVLVEELQKKLSKNNELGDG